MALVNAAGLANISTIDELKNRPELAKDIGMLYIDERYPVDEVQHMPASMYRRLYPKEYDNYFKFTFVRDPYQQLASTYFNENSLGPPLGPSLEEARSYSILEHQRLFYERILEAKKKIDFSKIVGILINVIGIERTHKVLPIVEKLFLQYQYPGKKMFPKTFHWMLQSYFLDAPVDFVGRVENITEDIRIVEEKLKRKLTIRKLNTHGRHDYQKLFTKETLELINGVYKQDFVRFGYSRQTGTID